MLQEKMESLSKQELIGTITKQADQIKRYETRLRDVVAAYKGLIKEKEALEISLKALNKTESANEGGDKDDSLAALTLSLSTLSAEKTRMEEAFQADKKVTRDKYENQIATMKEETKSLVQQHLAEINNLKAKIAYEIQEREKERADHSAMLKELHLKLNAERKSKEKLENDVVHTSEAESCQAELEKRVRDLSVSLEASERRVARASARASDTPAALRRLTAQLQLLQATHDRAMRHEEIKVKRAEESARKAVARQEERVALLEDKLAELSQTIGEYDLRKRKDEELIKQLRDTLHAKLLERDEVVLKSETRPKSETDNEKLLDSEYIQTLVDRIQILKKELIAENEKLGFPVDISTVFTIEDNHLSQSYENIHLKCGEELERVKSEFAVHRAKHESEMRINNEAANMQIDILKKKLETYKMVLEEEKRDKEAALVSYEEKLKSEKRYHLEERSELVERVERLERRVETLQMSAPTRPAANVSAPTHMLHYAEELARKDHDISQLRKEKHTLEGDYRDCQREGTIEKERFKEVIRNLKEEIDRLRRSQSREGANLEYLKNVVMAYLMSTDYAGRKHMLNAIGAVLHFTDKEKKMVLSIL